MNTLDTDTATREELVVALRLLSDKVAMLEGMLADAVPLRWLTREQLVEVFSISSRNKKRRWNWECFGKEGYAATDEEARTKGAAALIELLKGPYPRRTP